MTSSSIEFRLARLADVPALQALIARSVRELQSSDYTSAQLDAAIGTVFGVDRQLIQDGTYFVAESGGRLVGCGGWSKRRALYGADAGRTVEGPLRDPRTEPAMIRAFFVAPEFARRGIGRELLRRSESAARAAGFGEIEIVATLAGERLYASCGYAAITRYDIALANAPSLPVVRMRRS